MQKRRLGKTGLLVTELGFGGAEIGFQSAEQTTVERLLNSALDAGLNVIDTAECYNNSEELIGKAVSHRRSEYYLFSKCGHASGFDRPDWDTQMLEQSIERSLRRLRADYLDLMQLHSCSEAILRQGDVITTLHRARESGKIRFLGYSGDGPAALYAVQCGAFDALQTSVSIADQEAIDRTLPIAIENDIGVIAKRPIANAAWRSSGRKPDNAYAHPYWERLQTLDYDFLKAELLTSIGIALRFTLSVPGIHTAIVGTANPERWRQNAALLEGGGLSAELYHAIRNRWKAIANADWRGQT